MITGFNTDIDYNGVKYHVQTEDKGLKTPLILSLVYHRGTILASKRSPYDDLLLGEFSEKELAKRLNRQHKLICAAIRAGRVDELKKMDHKDSAVGEKKAAPPREKPAEKPAKEKLYKESPLEIDSINDLPEYLEAEPEADHATEIEYQPIPKPPVTGTLADAAEPKNDPVVPEILETPGLVQEPLPGVEKPSIPLDATLKSDKNAEARQGDWQDEPIIEGVSVIEDEIIMPAEAVEIINESTSYNPELPDLLALRIINESEAEFRGGESHIVSILVNRGNSGDIVAGASLMIKVLGTTFKPLIFHSKTDNNGVATVGLQLPHFSRGRAAVLIKAMSGNEEIEIRKIIIPG